MNDPCRSWWRNCALEADPEILEIDRLGDEIGPIDPDLLRIRGLITSLELCHHKADRWITNIIQAIGAGDTDKGLGTRPEGQVHSAERVWQSACAALSAWCAGGPSASVELSVGSVPATELLATLGERTALKEWQVQRVVERIRSLIHWPRANEDPNTHYVPLLLSGGDYECAFRTECPEQYKEREDLWLATVRTTIRDTVSGQAAKLSLALAIDMLWPCHWRFVENLQLVLAAIGGQLLPKEPFAACGRNLSMLPGRRRLEVVCNTLQAFRSAPAAAEEIDEEILAVLGEPTPEKKWLAASLDKTVRLQLSPPPGIQEQSALSGPAW
ncbi:MAG: hypothetical protein ACYSUM_10120 [Planctomycetota bacterium]